MPMSDGDTLPGKVDCNLEISEIGYRESLDHKYCHADIRGSLKDESGNSFRTFKLTADYDKQTKRWSINPQSVQWGGMGAQPHVDALNTPIICQVAARALKLLSIQPSSQDSSNGTKLVVGLNMTSPDQTASAVSIVRFWILDHCRLKWNQLWSSIENRLMYDPEFSITGFTRQDALDAIAVLKSIFPGDWVRKRFQKFVGKSSEPGMWEPMAADKGFPAYLLARTATGFACKDPGWNYLITLARSCTLLKNFANGKRLVRNIAKEPGHIHQINFSALLLKRGMLVEIEPSTGSGNAKHDLAARIDDRIIDIEIKSLTTSSPSRRVTDEIAEKCKKLPSTSSRPVVFFVLLVEKSDTDHKSWSEHFNEITSTVFQSTTKISAVVIGKMFVDAAGGEIKWSFEKFLLNQKASRQIPEDQLRKIFAPNWVSLSYPLMPIVFTYFSTNRDSQLPAQ